MFLHELPRDDEVGTKIYCEASDGSEFIYFHHVDGMYSYCTTEKTKSVVHLGIMTLLEPFEDGYKIAEEPPEEEVTPVVDEPEEEEPEESEEDDEDGGSFPLGDLPSFDGFGGGESGGGGSNGSW